MKTASLVLCLVIAAAACAVVGCDELSTEGLDAGGASVDASDDVFTVYGEVEPNENLPDDSKQEFDGEVPDNLDPIKVCTPYLGTWHCVCEDGDCCEGCDDFRIIELLQVTDYVMDFAVTILPNDEFDVFVCDPAHLPVTDALFGAVDLELVNSTTMKLTTTSPFGGGWWVVICIRQ